MIAIEISMKSASPSTGASHLWPGIGSHSDSSMFPT